MIWNLVSSLIISLPSEGSGGKSSPFLVCGNKASRSFIKCRIRCVTPREEMSRFLSFLGFILFSLLALATFSSVSPLLLDFPFPLSFLFCTSVAALSTDGMVYIVWV